MPDKKTRSSPHASTADSGPDSKTNLGFDSPGRDSGQRKFKRAHTHKRTIEHLNSEDFRWIAPLAKALEANADVLARYLAEVMSVLAVSPAHAGRMDRTRWQLTVNLAKVIFPQAGKVLDDVATSLHTLEAAFGEVSSELLRDPELTSQVIEPAIRTFAAALHANPQLAMLLGHPEILKESFGPWGDKISAVLAVLPALSARAAASFPELKETFFKALFRLSEAEHAKLYALAETILREVYKAKIFPRLQETLASDPRGRVLTPILLGAIEAIPGESCLNACIAIACTPQASLNTGRVIALAIQELGGLYVKISQVIAELCPPSLARELRTTQDDAGGLYPSVAKSWEFLLETLSDAALAPWRRYLLVPNDPMPHFASASVGALYEIALSEEGKMALGRDTVLIKLQRPGLQELLSIQSEHLIGLCASAHHAVERDATLAAPVRAELLGLTAAIRRAVINYYKQSASELDFTHEKTNAERVRAALARAAAIRTPDYFLTTPTVVLMERMRGTKVTKIVQTKYLERREIADAVIRAYLELVFEKGVVWADPHPGNILYDDEGNVVSMIDLNPCFVWDRKTREHFKDFLYRLILRDANGVYSTLYNLVDNPEALHSNTLVDDLRAFLEDTSSATSLTRFVGELIRTLGENEIDLRLEVQAALRGLSQLALTANAISARNSFGLLLRRHFGLKEMMSAVWDVGFVRVIRVATSILFDLTRQNPEEDVGPVLDERDLRRLAQRARELSRANVCDVQIVRVSPEDNPSLRLSVDGSYLLVTSHLRIHIVEKRRPATVRYVIEIPTQAWLKERQEFVKLSSIARNFCKIECLEQLRRNSLDDYWRTVETWSKPRDARTVEETRLVGQVQTAARKLYALRFSNIWETSLSGLPQGSRRVWRLLIRIESWREEAEHKYLSSLRQKFGNVVFTNIAFSTFYRLKMILVEGLLWVLRARIKANRFNMSLLPMTGSRLEDLILFSLSRNFTLERRES